MARFDLSLSDIGVNRLKKLGYDSSISYNPKLRIINKSSQQLANITAGIDRAMIRAILDISDNLERNLALAITSSIWATNNGLDDIYLSGDLLRSGEVTASNTNISIGYDAPYAALIHYGGYIKPYGSEYAQKVYIPPRPWIQAVIDGTNGLPGIDYRDIVYKALSNNI